VDSSSQAAASFSETGAVSPIDQCSAEVLRTLKELVDDAKQRPTHSAEGADLQALGNRNTGSIRDLQTTMTAIVQDIGQRT
jgi:hypothetical protein